MMGMRIAHQNAAPEDSSLPGLTYFAAAAVVVVALTVMVVWQGGFYSVAACAVGLAVSAAVVALAAVRFAASGARSFSLPVANLATPTLLCLVAVAYCVSACLSGLSLTSCAEALSWGVVAAIALLCWSLDRNRKTQAVSAVAWIGIVLAYIALLVYAGIVPLPGGMESGRLQFPFQYANTSGIWFCCVALLAAGSPSKRLPHFSCIAITALLVTQSVGAIGVAVVVSASTAVVWMRSGSKERAKLYMSQCGAGLLGGALCLVGPSPYMAVAAFALLLGYSFASERVSGLTVRPFVSGLLVVGLLAAAGAYLAWSGRLPEAAQTFIERFIQMGDAATLIGTAPVLGIGPDAWKTAFPFVQSAQYSVSVVHCSYLQIALDAGLFGLALVVAAVVIGAINVCRCGQTWLCPAVAALALHSLVDFDLRFAALSTLLALLLCGGSREEGLPSRNRQESDKRPFGQIAVASRIADGATAIAGLAMAALCAIGLWAGIRLAFFEEDVAGCEESVIAEYEQDALAQADTTAQVSYVQALYRLGREADAARFLQEGGVRTGAQALVLAQIQAERGDRAAACETMVAELEREPLNVDLFEGTSDLFETYAIDPETVGASLWNRYESAVERANELSQAWPASLLDNQKEVVAFEG